MARDEIVTTISIYHDRTGYPLRTLLSIADIPAGKFYDWRNRVLLPNRHHGILPREHWLLPWEKAAIIDYARHHAADGYRRLCYQMIDEDVVYVSSASVYRVLHDAGLLTRWQHEDTSLHGTGYRQPTAPHQEWHTDITYVNVLGTFLFLIAVLDGYSRYVVHHEVRASMEGEDVTVVLQRARERYPDENPRVISDRGGQFIAREFKEYIRSAGLTQTLISAGYPQSNGKIERFYKTVKTECVRRSSFLSVADARRIIAEFIEYYNTKRLHSALDYLTPLDILHGRRDEILKTREEKRERAKALRRKQCYQISTLNQTPVLSDSR